MYADFYALFLFLFFVANVHNGTVCFVLDPRRPAFIEYGQIVRIGCLAYNIVNLLGNGATLIAIRIASLQFHAYLLPHGDAVSIAFLFVQIGST